MKKKKSHIYCSWEHDSWGNSIQVKDWNEGRIVGWLSRRPDIGDRIIFKMKSGKLGETKVIEVDYCSDPNDMFFATLKEVDYITEEELDKRLKIQNKNMPRFRFL